MEETIRLKRECIHLKFWLFIPTYKKAILMHESYGYICFIAVFHFQGRNYPIYVYIEKIKRLKTVLLHCELIMVAFQFIVIVTIYRILYRIYICIGSQKQGQLSNNSTSV